MGHRRTTSVHILVAFMLLAGTVRAHAADIHVSAGGDLQAAINAAQPGDTLLLEPGATFIGNFRLPVHGGTTYITIRSAADDAVLPPHGVRISPAHAPHLPKIKSINSSPALATRDGAAYWRLMFLEFPATHKGYYDIVTLGDGSSNQWTLEQVPHHLVLDRVYVHGDRLHGQKRGIAINSASTTIVNSHVSEIKAIGQDSVAVGGWNGPGPFIIENNYLEAAGEVFMLGGSDPAIQGLVPTDVLVQRNTLTRPLSWRDPIVSTPVNVEGTVSTGGLVPAGVRTYRVVARQPAHIYTAYSLASQDVTMSVGSDSRVALAWDAVADATEYAVYMRTDGASEVYWTVGGASFVDDGYAPGKTGSPPSATRWLVKNLLELKNARQVRILRNTFRNNWAHAQTGSAILFTPRNQGGQCGWCVVEDVVFEHNVLRGAGGGIVILGWDNEKPSQQTNRIRIRHNVVSDLGSGWGGSGYFLQLLDEPRDVIVDHNTIVAPQASGVVGVDSAPISGFVFTNNVSLHNAYGIIGRGHGVGNHTITAFFPDGVVTKNVLAARPEPYKYPEGNLFPSAAEFEAHFVDYAGGDYAIAPGTDWAGAGTDGLDLGANMAGAPVEPIMPMAPRNPRIALQ